jgi:GDP-L-fucose synthase
MDVKDFVRVLVQLAPALERDVVNVGPGRGSTIRDLVAAVSRAAGYQGRVVFNADRYVGVKEKFIDATKLREKYGCTIPAALDEGIRRTVAWYAEHYETLWGRRKFG